jgi:hypothetical protein
MVGTAVEPIITPALQKFTQNISPRIATAVASKMKKLEPAFKVAGAAKKVAGKTWGLAKQYPFLSRRVAELGEYVPDAEMPAEETQTTDAMPAGYLPPELEELIK